ncbi:MAG: hypothetical protein CSA66_03600 [Proteobacteria bacterium]|nr:MAG: hypothetical protein CSA66_03600 [Pseudomonadota bacterium]
MTEVSAIGGLIFDLDGTLVDSLADIADGMEHVLARRGLPGHPRDAYRRFVGDGVRRLVARATPPEVHGRLDALVDSFRERYFAHGLDQTHPYDGVEPLLARCAAAGIPMAVVSNKPHALAVEVVAALLGDTPFAAVIGQRDGVPHKPDPRGALEAAEAMGVSPAAVAFVGDSGVDVETARRAQMRAVAVTWGFRGRDELAAAGPDHMVDSPAELWDLIGLGRRA